MKGQPYQCARCQGVFISDRDDAEALAEQLAMFPHTAGEPYVRICDPCHQDFMRWARKQDILQRPVEH